MLTAAEFEAAVDDALDSLPLDVVQRVGESNTVILVRDEPPDGEGDLLGLYEGGGFEPGRILIFKGPLERAACSREHLVHEIRVTVLHEIGHLFGMDERRLHELGWG